mmetsp:Transcript_1294/g.4843  ORF Transcript_1294/g.4843 Transcript_1294/m.4843 type:complete len:217 (+) Transcript_1294:2074-2724(+)
MRLGGDGPLTARVPQHQVGVGTDGDGPFAGKYVEYLCRVGGRDGDEFRRREHPRFDSLGPEHRHSILHAAGAVGNLPEIVLPHRLLRRAEAAVIRRGGVYQPRLQALPEQTLVPFGPKRRRHHVVRGEGPIRVSVHRIVDDEVLRENLGEHALPLAPRPPHSLERVLAARVHQVQGDAENLGDANRRVGRFALNLRRSAQRVPLRSDVPALVHLFL